MNMFMEIVLFFIVYFVWIEAVPPEACFANFRWDDCGQAPVPVMYYWKPGSRCEVGLWRGCLPNINMFQDEYECVATCIYTARVGDEDYHNINAIGEAEIIYDETTVATARDIGTSSNVTIGGNNATGTTTISAGNAIETTTGTTSGSINSPTPPGTPPAVEETTPP